MRSKIFLSISTHVESFVSCRCIHVLIWNAPGSFCLWHTAGSRPPPQLFPLPAAGWVLGSGSTTTTGSRKVLIDFALKVVMRTLLRRLLPTDFWPITKRETETETEIEREGEGERPGSDLGSATDTTAARTRRRRRLEVAACCQCLCVVAFCLVRSLDILLVILSRVLF